MAAYKRRNYLINPRFQLKFSFMICLVIIISSIVYPFTIYELVSKYIAIISIKNPGLMPTLEDYRSTLLLILTLWQIGFTCLIFIICIFFSHKVAGPMFKLKKFLTSIRETGQYGKLFFRKSDYFQEMASEINQTLDYLDSKNENKEAIIRELEELEANGQDEDKRRIEKIKSLL